MSHYNATLPMVQGWIPNITINSTSKPSDSEVTGFIAMHDNDVFFAVGSLRNIDNGAQPDLRASILDQAQKLVAMRAAADAYDVHFPEHASDPQEFGARTKALYTAMLANLAKAAQRGTSLDDSVVVAGGPLWAIPGNGARSLYPLWATRLEPGTDLADEGDLGLMNEMLL